MKNAFIFDINKCVSCHACVIACVNENSIEILYTWRQVSTFNDLKHPDLPVFYYSIACNHCDEAPCMKNCPANAYTRDEKTNAIIHHAERCIGCKYCTWACPYDAPKYNKNTRVIEKCTFCNHRLEEGLKPACALNCPTGALDFGTMESEELHISPAFVDIGIGPSIKLIPLKDKKLDISDSYLSDINPNDFINELQKAKNKVNALHEWPLILFTLISSFLVSWFLIFELLDINFDSMNYNFEFNLIFVGIGILGALLSMAHLGRIFRAYRSIFNIKNSWLSREILFYSLFLLGTMINLIYEYKPIQIITFISGAACLISIDMVYKLVESNLKLKINSAWVGFSFLLFTTYFIDVKLFILLISIKTVVYIINTYYSKQAKYKFIFSLLKISFSLIIPLIIITIKPEQFILILAFVILGELIGRIEFYNSLFVNTPSNEILSDLKSNI